MSKYHPELREDFLFLDFTCFLVVIGADPNGFAQINFENQKKGFRIKF